MSNQINRDEAVLPHNGCCLGPLCSRRRRNGAAHNHSLLLAAISPAEFVPIIASKPPRRLIDEVIRLTGLNRFITTLLYGRFRRVALHGFMSYYGFRSTLGILALLDESFFCERLFQAFDLINDGYLDFLEWATAIGIMMNGTGDRRLQLSFRVIKSPLSTSPSEKPLSSIPPDSYPGSCFWSQSKTTTTDMYIQARDNPKWSKERWNLLYGPDGSDRIGPWRPCASSEAVRLSSVKEQDDVVAAEQMIQELLVPSGSALALDEFVHVVKSLERTRAQLCGDSNVEEVSLPSLLTRRIFQTSQIETAFRSLTSRCDEDGQPLMFYDDFKLAVGTSEEFLSMLGAQPSARLNTSLEETNVQDDDYGQNEDLDWTNYIRSRRGDGLQTPLVGSKSVDYSPLIRSDKYEFIRPRSSANPDDSEKRTTKPPLLLLHSSMFINRLKSLRKSLNKLESMLNLQNSTVGGADTAQPAITKETAGAGAASSSSDLMRAVDLIRRFLYKLGATMEPDGPSAPRQTTTHSSGGIVHSVGIHTAGGPMISGSDQLTRLTNGLRSPRVGQAHMRRNVRDLKPLVMEAAYINKETVRKRLKSNNNGAGSSASFLATCSINRCCLAPESSEENAATIPIELYRHSLPAESRLAGCGSSAQWRSSASNVTSPMSASSLDSSPTMSTPMDADDDDDELGEFVSYKAHSSFESCDVAPQSPLLRRRSFLRTSMPLAAAPVSREVSMASSSPAAAVATESIEGESLSAEEPRLSDDLLADVLKDDYTCKDLMRIAHLLESAVEARSGGVSTRSTDMNETLEIIEEAIGLIEEVIRMSSLRVAGTQRSRIGDFDSAAIESSSPRVSESQQMKVAEVAPVRECNRLRDSSVLKVVWSEDWGNSSNAYHPAILSNRSYSVRSFPGSLHPAITMTMPIQKPMYTNPPNFEALRRGGAPMSTASASNKRFTFAQQTKGKVKRRRVEAKILDSGPRGLVVHFGHESWNMVLNMMIGIRMAATRAGSESLRHIEPYDFIMKEKFSILPKLTAPRSVYGHMGQHDYSVVRFVDYAPMVFRKLRETVNLDKNLYLRSVGPEQLIGNMILGNFSSLSELCSEGKSGALFYYTADGKFLVKTLTKSSAQFFQSILKAYYSHVMNNPGTLITRCLNGRFYGFHAIRLKNYDKKNASKTLYFTVMGNIFHTPVILHKRYDLKGSWVGRTVVVGPQPTTLNKVDEDQITSGIARKDLDFINSRETIKLGADLGPRFLKAINLDAEFLKSINVLDYSLLFGVHTKRPTADEANSHPPEQSQPSLQPLHQPSLQQQPPDDAIFPWLDSNGMQSSDGKSIYFCGIIDMFTQWTALKSLEHLGKSLVADSHGISCVNPAFYADRFVKFMTNIVES